MNLVRGFATFSMSAVLQGHGQYPGVGYRNWFGLEIGLSESLQSVPIG